MSSHTVVVTGASGGLGSVIAPLLESRGWNVISWTQDEVNLTDADATHQAFTHITSQINAVVHLVGGITAGRPVQDMRPDELTIMIDLNLRTTFNVMRASMPRLIQTRGALVTIGAAAALHPAPMKSLYAASKAGVHALTLAAAEEGRQHGVRAVCIAPTIIDTPANHSWSTEEERADWVQPYDMAVMIEAIIDPHSLVTSKIISMP